MILPQSGSKILKKKPNPEGWVVAKTLKLLNRMGNIPCTNGWVSLHIPGVINITGTFHLWLNYVSLNWRIFVNVWNSLHDVQWSLRCPHQRQAVGRIHKGLKIMEWQWNLAKLSGLKQEPEGQRYKYSWSWIWEMQKQTLLTERFISNQVIECCTSDALSMEDIKVWCWIMTVIWAAMDGDILPKLFICSWSSSGSEIKCLRICIDCVVQELIFMYNIKSV